MLKGFIRQMNHLGVLKSFLANPRYICTFRHHLSLVIPGIQEEGKGFYFLALFFFFKLFLFWGWFPILGVLAGYSFNFRPTYLDHKLI